ncbi:MAG TPA: maltose alpha-D-glucosyltransferase [Pirellulales bacterium]|nr:maltose alpha-D-glucosyltransferase [Pirellulales bacterium]
MANVARSTHSSADGTAGREPLWYKDAVIYQLHVRAYCDSDANGIGDFAGLTQKLDYLQDLGVTALWLLPFYPSPLRDGGYDIAEYTSVNPAYGDLRDFKTFIREAHARGLRVITELVINHTSDQHPWFQRARRAKPGSPERDFYVWSDTPQRYEDARIIFKDFEVSNWSWDPLAKAYYWHRFYSHQPDLNFENPAVHKAVLEALDYWMRLGVDGVRLDAVPYLYEREGTNCENLPETHDFLKKLRRHVDDSFADRMLLAEANQWPEDAIAYFGSGDECHTAFHFPVMPRLFMALHMEDRFPIVDILQQTPPIPADCQWLIFLRNHDELTLEMVTDEERDYMYRAYARDRHARINLGIRRRLAPLLGNSRRKIELMNALLCSLPGTPVVYYGDEIGMGDNIYLGDRDGVRTPMQWSPDRNAGFSAANPQQLYSPLIIDSEYLYEAVNVETQQKNPSSLLWWMKRLIALRQHEVALRRGDLELLAPENSKVLAFTRQCDGRCVLVVANLSRFVQYVELDLSRFAGRRLVEMFGQSHFPLIGKVPYPLSINPHSFFWFTVEAEVPGAGDGADADLPLEKLDLPESWKSLEASRTRKALAGIVRRNIPHRPWFDAKGRSIQAVTVFEVIPLSRSPHRPGPCLAIVRVEYLEGEPEGYLLPLGIVWGTDAEHLLARRNLPLLAEVRKPAAKETGVLFDSADDPATPAVLLETIVHQRHFKAPHGQLVGWSMPHLSQIVAEAGELRPLTVRSEERDNYTVFGDKLLLTMFRHLELGVNPAFEIGRFLARTNFRHILPLVGALEYRMADDTVTIGVLHEYVPNTVSAWQFASDALGRFCEQSIALPADHRPVVSPESAKASLWDLAAGNVPPLASELIGEFLDWSAALGQRTGELHLALAEDHGDPNFTPEPFSALYQRSLYQSSRKLAVQVLEQLRQRLATLPDDGRALAEKLLESQRTLLETLREVVSAKIVVRRIRCHGDYHLAHVLYTGRDFLMVDFYGEPTLPLTARRIKRSAVDDLAGMVYSFQHVAAHTLARHFKGGMVAPEAVAAWQNTARFWTLWSSSAFLRAYATTTANAELLPQTRAHWDLLLRFHLLAEALYELRSALLDEPDQTPAALTRILELMG